jgi:hypothetical protein
MVPAVKGEAELVQICTSCTGMGLMGWMHTAVQSFVLRANGLRTACTLVLLLQHMLWHIHRVVHCQASPVHVYDLACHVAGSI